MSVKLKHDLERNLRNKSLRQKHDLVENIYCGFLNQIIQSDLF